MTSITPKAASATAGAGASTPLSILVIWLIELIPAHADPFHVVVPAVVAAAIASIMAAGLAFLGAYIAPRSEPTPEQKQAVIVEHEASQDPQPPPTKENQNWNTQP